MGKSQSFAIFLLGFLVISRWWQLKGFLFLPLLGEMIDFHKYFSDGLKPPTKFGLLLNPSISIYMLKQIDEHTVYITYSIHGISIFPH